LLPKAPVKRVLLIGTTVLFVLGVLLFLVQYPNYKRAKEEYARKYRQGSTDGGVP
jgi:hypothetical protein